MDRPIVTQMAEAVYAELPDKIRQVDADNGYPHLIYIEAHCRPMAIIYEMVRDHSGIEGWATLWQTNPQAPAITDEITQVPDEAIRFAAQFLGQRLPAGLNTVDVHQRYTEIKDRTRRGGRRSIFKALAKAVYGDSYYTGPETDLEDTPGLWILERPNGNAWRLLVSMDKDLMPESDTQQVNIVAPSDFAVQSSGTGQVVTFTALNRAIGLWGSSDHRVSGQELEQRRLPHRLNSCGRALLRRSECRPGSCSGSYDVGAASRTWHCSGYDRPHVFNRLGRYHQPSPRHGEDRLRHSDGFCSGTRRKRSSRYLHPSKRGYPDDTEACDRDKRRPDVPRCRIVRMASLHRSWWFGLSHLRTNPHDHHPGRSG
jgi:hypothetical protein